MFDNNNGSISLGAVPEKILGGGRHFFRPLHPSILWLWTSAYDLEHERDLDMVKITRMPCINQSINQLFKTGNIDLVKCCKSYFSFELPSVLHDRRARKFDIKYRNHSNVFCQMIGHLWIFLYGTLVSQPSIIVDIHYGRCYIFVIYSNFIRHKGNTNTKIDKTDRRQTITKKQTLNKRQSAQDTKNHK